MNDTQEELLRRFPELARYEALCQEANEIADEMERCKARGEELIKRFEEVKQERAKVALQVQDLLRRLETDPERN